jgi:hypothetical protein
VIFVRELNETLHRLLNETQDATAMEVGSGSPYRTVRSRGVV